MTGPVTGAFRARWRVLLLAALAFVLALFLPAPAASANPSTAAGTRVGVISPTVTHLVGVHECITAGQRPVRGPSQSQIVSGHCVAAEDVGAAGSRVPQEGDGIVYRRTDLAGSKPYIGQAKSDARFLSRQAEHARANPDADFEFEIVGRANPGTELDRLEEFFIRQEGGPTNLRNPNGLLSNLRHQMNDTRYQAAGGDF